jgi:Ca2+-binding EF-hand superfamily protein
MKNLKLLTIGLCIATMTMLAAQDLSKRGSLPFSTYDINNDGKITSKEFNDIKAQRMNEKYQDGKLMRKARHSPAFEDIDINKDTVISKDELNIHQKAQLNKNQRAGNKQNKGKGMNR